MVPDADPSTPGIVYERLHRLVTGLGAAARRDRRRHARPPDGRRLATCRTCSPTCSSRRPRGALGTASGCRATGPSFRDATRVAGANPASGATSTAPTATRSSAAIDGAIVAAAGRPRRARGRRRRRRHRLERGRPRGSPRACWSPGWRAARCASCASRCRTARASSPSSRWRSGRQAINIADMGLCPVARQAHRHASRCGSRRRRAPTARADALGRARARHPRWPREPCASTRRTPLRGTLAPPPDKSISHRAALFGAMATSPSRITNYLDAADTHSTLAAVRALGAIVEQGPTGSLDPRHRPARGRRGRHDRRRQRGHADAAAARLARRPAGRCTLDGDASIRRRPVDRVAEPLRADGRRDRRRRRAASRRSPCTARRCAGSSTSCRSPARRSSRACCSPGCWPGGTTTVDRARAQPRPHRADAGARGRADRRDGDRIELHASTTSSSSGRSTCRATRRRPRSWSRPRCSCRGSRLVITRLGANWTRTGLRADPRADGRGSSSATSSAGRATIPRDEPVGDLDVARRAAVGHDRRAPTRSRWRSTSCRSSRCSAASPRARRSSAAPQELRLKESDRIATVVDGPARPRRRHRGHRRRLRRHAATGGLRGGTDRRPRRPPPRDARRGRRAGLARGRRGRRHGGRRRLLPGLRGRPRRPSLFPRGDSPQKRSLDARFRFQAVSARMHEPAKMKHPMAPYRRSCGACAHNALRHEQQTQGDDHPERGEES